jgi:hypothetical protein
VSGARGRIVGVEDEMNATSTDAPAGCAAVLEAIPVSVIVSPGSGTNLSGDWWSMELRELGIAVCEYGLETTERALVHAIAAETRERLNTSNLSASESALVIRLDVAARNGLLSDLLQAAQVVELATR